MVKKGRYPAASSYLPHPHCDPQTHLSAAFRTFLCLASAYFLLMYSLLDYMFCSLRPECCSSTSFALLLFVEYLLQTGRDSPGKLLFIPQNLNVLFDMLSAAQSPRYSPR